jgi:adenosylmethionine-8-amino-7-oxononanoate aminotransferase
MKMARQYFFDQGQTQRKHLVSRRQGYHGNTIRSMSISTNLARKVQHQDALTLAHVSHVSPEYAYQYKYATKSEEEYVTRLIDELDVEFLRVGPHNVIAFVAEPVVGPTSGCVPSSRGLFSSDSQTLQQVWHPFGVRRSHVWNGADGKQFCL